LRRKEALETSVATLLLVTSAVILSCVVVSYAVTTVEQTMNMQNIPQLDHLKSLTDQLLNQTDSLYNQTVTDIAGSPLPTLPPS
jgi:hypothetical protein